MSNKLISLPKGPFEVSFKDFERDKPICLDIIFPSEEHPRFSGNWPQVESKTQVTNRIPDNYSFATSSDNDYLLEFNQQNFLKKNCFGDKIFTKGFNKRALLYSAASLNTIFIVSAPEESTVIQNYH